MLMNQKWNWVGCLAFCAAVLTLFAPMASAESSDTSLQRIGVVTEKIVGGGPANEGENRWITSLQGGASHFCGASLIDDRWVLTAAHCVEGETASGVTVWIGGYDLRRPDQGTRIQVSNIFSHENYDGQTLANDIALLELAEDAPASLPRVKLPTAEVMAESATAGDMVTVSGWGALSEGGSSPDRLHEVVVPVVSNQACNAPESYNGQIIQSMICAGLRSGGKDSCQGDSGGPLWVEHQQEEYLVGLVSFGEGCAQPNKYGVYTRVVSFLDWIQQIKDGGGSGGGGGGGNPQCMDIVCSIDPYCCEVEFDSICEDIASQQCDDGGGSGGGNSCLQQVCEIDSYCCEVEFDFICEDIEAEVCFL